MKKAIIIQLTFLLLAISSAIAAICLMVQKPTQITVATLLSLSLALSFVGTFIHEILIEHFAGWKK
jgi:hypothetical protein